MTDRPATVPMLHRFLGIGLVSVMALAILLKYFGVVPLLPTDDVTRKIAYVISGISAALIGYAVAVLKPRALQRTAMEAIDQDRSTPASVTLVLPVWFLLEGAGMLSIVGYGLTDNPLAATTMVIAVVTFWLCGPQAFAKPAGT